MRRLRPHPRILALMAVGLAVLVVGCDREGNSIWDEIRTPSPGATSPFTQTPGARTPATATPVAVPTRDVSEEDLEAMVLTLAELGDNYSTFERDAENSGPQTRTDRIDDACDPQDETNDLEKTHWVAGYDQVYGIKSASFLLSGPTEGQTFLVGSSLDLYRDELGAGD